jgi:hypothetical protein
MIDAGLLLSRLTILIEQSESPTFKPSSEITKDVEDGSTLRSDEETRRCLMTFR